MKRRALALMCAGILAVGMLTGCGSKSDKKDSTETATTAKTESDGTFTVALNYMPTSLEPNTVSDDQTLSLIHI